MKPKFILSIAAIFAGISVISAVRSGFSGKTADTRLLELKRDVYRLENENLALQREYVYRQSPEFVEREARDKLRMIKDGERILLIAKEGDVLGLEATESADIKETAIWRQWFNKFFN